ncbi:MAG TPA: sterol desaturase family protein [Usitatibacter sp.]|nr:sterol desaturase family protein [Usitatibacter sp.]
MPGVEEFFRMLGSTLGFIALVYAVAMVFERLAPAERGQPWARIRFNLVLGVVLFTISSALVAVLTPLIAPLVTSPIGQRIRLEFPDGAWGSLGQVLAFFLIYDFFYYWWHRAQHELPWLWPQHELHHSDTALNITTSLRHHWLEDPLRVFAMAAPLGFAFYFKPASIPWIATVVGLWPFFIHANVRLHLGWLAPVVAGPQYHRIHHSIEPAHWNRNYAAFFPVWDVVFGTAYFPKRGEFPRTGVARGEPRSMADALVAPFRDWREQLRGRRASA